MLLSLHYVDDLTPLQIFNAHREFAARHKATPIAGIEKRRSNALLRIGYLSSNFQQHSVAYFFEPVLKAHDRSQVEVYCYHNAAGHDEVTDRIRSHSDHWREIAG